MIQDIRRSYERLAPIYDRRWRRYNERTLNAVLAALALSGHERLLDIGCGTGEFERLALRRCPTVTAVGVDLVSSMIDVARMKLHGAANVTFQVGQIESLPFRPGAFDAVVCANMLHHVQDPRQALQECVRVLRPRGQLVLVDWCRDFWCSGLLHAWSRVADRSYVRMYGARELSTLVEHLGARVARIERFWAPPVYGMMLLKALNVGGPT